MKVFVTVYDNKYGTDVAVFVTEAQALEAKQDIADEWWEEEYPNVPKPTDPQQMADEYFENHMEEWFIIEECEVKNDL